MALVLALVAGCSRKPADATPEGVVHLWLEKMEAATDEPRVTREAFGLLGPAARANLEERAHRTATLQGRRVEAADMLAPGRFGLSFRPKAMRAVYEGNGAEARVEVTGADPSEHATVHCVREGVAWRVEPELPDPRPVPR